MGGVSGVTPLLARPQLTPATDGQLGFLPQILFTMTSRKVWFNYTICELRALKVGLLF